MSRRLPAYCGWGVPNRSSEVKVVTWMSWELPATVAGAACQTAASDEWQTTLGQRDGAAASEASQGGQPTALAQG